MASLGKFGSLALALALGPTACGGAPDGEPPAKDDLRFETLVASEWSLEAGAETYYCVRKTLTEDLWVRAFDALATEGTHHTVLTFGEPDAPDGVVECGSFDNHEVMAYGTGVGARPFVFPEGVAVKVPAGKQLLLNLHVFNTGAEPLSGLSGVRAAPAARGAEAGLTEAEAVLMGPMDLTIPPGKQAVEGCCTLRADATLFAVAPHMHQLGTHMLVTAESSAAGTEILHDAPYDFEDQQVSLLPAPVSLKKGDRVGVRCDYTNTTQATVKFGESTLDEMCFAGIYRYPPDPTAFFVCTE
jgi:hypothetical protein